MCVMYLFMCFLLAVRLHRFCTRVLGVCIVEAYDKKEEKLQISVQGSAHSYSVLIFQDSRHIQLDTHTHTCVCMYIVCIYVHNIIHIYNIHIQFFKQNRNLHSEFANPFTRIKEKLRSINLRES